VRKAANLCVDREGLKDGLLAGLMVPATGTFEPGHPGAAADLRDQVRQAGRAEADAGSWIRSSKKLSVKIQTSASGSGQMLPLR